MSKGRKYFVKEDDGIFIVERDFFKTIESREEALMIGSRTYFELLKRLTEDALEGNTSYIGNMKVVTGLDRTLEALGKRFPCLLDELRAVERRHEGVVVRKC